MPAKMATSAPTTRAERVAMLLRKAQEECQAPSRANADSCSQELLDTVAEVLEGLIRALAEYPGQASHG
jgi:hypothetical protein